MSVTTLYTCIIKLCDKREKKRTNIGLPSLYQPGPLPSVTMATGPRSLNVDDINDGFSESVQRRAV